MQRLFLSARANRRGERGATLVEMALILPLLILIIVGITEVGLYFKEYLTISYASREGARVGSFAGNSADADCQILMAVGEVLGFANLEHVDRIEIFKADDSGNQQVTNIATLNGNDPTVCSQPASLIDGWTRLTAWSPADRQTLVGSRPLDVLGVKVVWRYSWVVGMPPFHGHVDIDESTLTRLEPTAFDT